MKTIIAGSRNINDYNLLLEAVNKSNFNITCIISGGAKGVDSLGERYSIEHKLPLGIFNAKWEKYGKNAGYLRNKEMVENADALIAIWDGKSKGTKHMIDIAKERELDTYVLNLEKRDEF